MMDPFVKYVKERVTVLTDETIRLGPVNFRLTSNVTPFPALEYFSDVARSPFNGETPEFELWCVSLDGVGLNSEYLREHVDRTYRAARFMEGYYVTDHFGPPLYLVTRGQRYYVFGDHFEQVVWPYFVKYFLTLHSLENSALHVKAATLAIGSSGTLVLGRSGAGKTVFLLQLCQSGAQFVTNTHALIKDGRVSGVASAMRVRPGEWFSNLAGAVGTTPSLKSGELNIDPYQVLDVYIGDSVGIRNLCIVDFRGAGCCTIDTISEQAAYDYAEQFVLAINAYRLEEDLLDLYGNDYLRFAQVYGEMKAQLRALIRRCRRYYISCDMFEKTCRDEVFALLSA
jgi:hypothetical protein